MTEANTKNRDVMMCLPHLCWAGILEGCWCHCPLGLEWTLQVGLSACGWSLSSFHTTNTHLVSLGLASLQHASLEATHIYMHRFFLCQHSYIEKYVSFNFRACVFTFRNSVNVLPQRIPLASWLLENSRSLARSRAYATRLLLLSNHTKMSGTVCWGCSVYKKS